jgi:hypothetical protein
MPNQIWPFPGSRWWKFDFHTHTPASLCRQTQAWQQAIGTPDEVTPEKWLLRYMEAEIDCVAITDHNSGEWVDKLKAAYEQMKADSPTGFRELHLFPGVELSVQGGIHLLALFTPESSAQVVNDLLATVRYDGTRGDSDGVTQIGLTDVLDEVARLGGLAIPAHVDKDKGLLQLETTGSRKSWFDANTLRQVFNRSDVLAIEHIDPNNLLPEVYTEAKAHWARVLGSDSHSFRGSAVPGCRYTWVKMANPSLEGLRLALMDGNGLSLRCSDLRDGFDPFGRPEHFITSIEIRNAKFMGRRQPERIEWSPYYNALIGGRGTGKSTVVHALRLAYRREDDLNPFPDKDSPKAVFDSFRNTARGTDGAGALLSDTEILVELVRDGLKHRITWRFGTQGDSVDDWDGTGWVVERFSQLEAWNAATVLETPEAIKLLGGLPTGLEDGGEEAKRFDLLVLNLQLAVLRKDAGWERLQDRMIAIAHALALKGNIPMVAAQIELIHDICSDLWWEGLTLPMLEQARRKLRDLVKLMDRVDRKVLYTDFTDELGEEKISEPVYVPMGVNMERFRAKARQFLLAHENHFTIHRLRMNEPLTPMDLEELEHMLREAGLGSEDELEKAKQESHGLGLFVRSLIGLDRAAAKAAFAGFLQGSTLNASQIDFLETLINHLTEHGAMDPALLYESPYTDINPMGVEGVFNPPQVETLLGVLAEIRRRAVA